MKKNKKQKPVKKNIFYYLKPKHMFGEITGWGFHYSKYELMKDYAIYIAVGIICSLLFGLDWKFTIAMVLIELLFVPALIVNHYKKNFYQNQFDEANDYIEQLLYSFKQSRKIITSLEYIETSFPEESPMAKAIKNAEDMILHGANDNPNVVKDALASIEAIYPIDRLRTVHQFVIKAEEKGGDFDNTLELLLNDRMAWEERNTKAANERNNRKNITTVSIVMSTLICAFFTRMIVKSTTFDFDTDIVLQNLASQLATLIMWFFMMLIYFVADVKSVADWGEKDKKTSEKLTLKRYYDVVNYDNEKERRKSFKYAGIMAIIALVFFIFKNSIAAIVCTGLTVLFLNQHTIGYRMKKKAVIRELNIAYPRWLMELALLLQTGNVQVSMYKSYENAPIILKPALEKFYKEIESNPTSKEPYVNFLKEFDIKGIHATMKMLYALYSGAGTDKDTQIANILRRNNEMLDIAEKIEIENSLAIYIILYLLPTLAMSLKLMTDMVVFLGVILSNIIV